MRKPPLSLRVLVTVLALGLLAPASPAAEACATTHLALHWTTFTPPTIDFALPRFYWGVEGSSVATKISTIDADCIHNPPRPAYADYSVGEHPPGTPRAATASSDFLPAVGRTPPMHGHTGPGPYSHQIDVNLPPDLGAIEPVAEQARALITGSDGRIEQPFDVQLYVIDDDGPNRLALEGGVREQSETYAGLKLAVFRAGPTPEQDVVYTAGGGSATPGVDFTTSGSIHLAAGQRVGLLEILIVNDKEAEPAEELTVTLTAPGPVQAGVDPVSSVVRILDNEEGSVGPAGGSAPVTRFHHPRHGIKYKRGDYRLREFHVFATDEGGSGVANVQLALRRTRMNGKCQWFNGKRFRAGPCGEKLWLGTTYLPDLDWWFYRLPELRPSMGTKIRSYRAFSRGIDGADNVEDAFKKGRNANRFEVKKAKQS